MSVQLEKVCLRDEMLNTFIKKKEQMSALKLNSVCEHDFIRKINGNVP